MNGYIFKYIGGMWGFFSKADRQLANHIFNLIINKNISRNYNKNKKSPKGFDQIFLSHHVYPLVRNNVLSHDSYLCGNYEKSSSPFPSRRMGNCFVGNPSECNPINGISPECPIKCRPKNHTDWKYC
jgi:hypothetical protein